MGLVSLVVVAAAAFWGLTTITDRQALEAVARESQQLARWTVAPALTTPAVRGDPAAVATADAVVRSRMSDGSVRRIMVWDRAGRIVYSDRPGLRGRRYRLPQQAAALFAGRSPAAVVAGTENVGGGGVGAGDPGGGDPGGGGVGGAEAPGAAGAAGAPGGGLAPPPARGPAPPGAGGSVSPRPARRGGGPPRPAPLLG